MKTLALILLFFFPVIAYSQNMPVQGQPNITPQYQGGISVDKYLVLPQSDTNTANIELAKKPNQRKFGSAVVNSQGVWYNDGVKWVMLQSGVSQTVTSVSFNASNGILTIVRNGASNLTTSLDGRYLQNESDPTVPSFVKSISTQDIANWTTAYNYGPHAGLYVLLSGTYANPSWISSLVWSKITGLPTTLTGYGITDAVNVMRTINGYPLSSNIFLSTTDISEGSNLYFTNSRARTSITVTTSGTGAASYNSSTGVLNIPTPTGTGNINNGGNSFSAPVVLGSNDAQPLVFRTNGVEVARYLSNGHYSFNGAPDVQSFNVLGVANFQSTVVADGNFNLAGTANVAAIIIPSLAGYGSKVITVNNSGVFGMNPPDLLQYANAASPPSAPGSGCVTYSFNNHLYVICAGDGAPTLIH